MNVVVRRAGSRDLDAIHTLWLALRELEAKADSRLAPRPESDHASREHRAMVLADPRTCFFVAEERGSVLGYLHAQIETNDPTYTPERYGNVVDMMVREDRRREGIGRRLVDYALEWIRSQGVRQYRVTLPVRSEEARALFASAGARPLATTYTLPLEP